MRAVVIVILVLLVAIGGVFVYRAQSGQGGKGLVRGGAAASGAGPARAAAKPAPKTQTLYVAVPQGIYLPFSKVAGKFEAAHPGLGIEMMVDTPEAMAQAVEENARKPDIFISPGGHEIEVLRQKGWIDAKTMVAFGSYELAIVVPRANPGKVSKLEDLLDPRVKTISISDPNLNAACYAARQSLQNLGLWDKVKRKTQVTGCCMSSFRWVLDGRAQANVQFLGCPMDENAAVAESSKVSFACKFPRGTYYVPRNVAGILKTTKQRPLAQEFLDYLTSAETIQFMLENRLRNDFKLPASPGPWGPQQEASPMKAAKGLARRPSGG
jgi:molybdate transport system substrate-binding protein